MTIDTLVKELEIMNYKEVNDTLARIADFEKERCGEYVVILIQNNLGGIYRIKSKSEAYNMINHPGKAEWGVGIYDKEYLSDLRDRLKDKSEKSNYKGKIAPRNALTIF